MVLRFQIHFFLIILNEGPQKRDIYISFEKWLVHNKFVHNTRYMGGTHVVGLTHMSHIHVSCVVHKLCIYIVQKYFSIPFWLPHRNSLCESEVYLFGTWTPPILIVQTYVWTRHEAAQLHCKYDNHFLFLFRFFY
jgi:hypothetical protein